MSGRVLASRVVVERFITEDDDEVTVEALDTDGEALRLYEVLGLLEFAKARMVHAVWWEDEEEDLL